MRQAKLLQNYRKISSEGLKTFLASFSVVLLCLLLLVKDPHFFWHDDYQSQYLGVFTEISRAWNEGEFPLISLNSWFGGALAGEYQYGVFSLFINICIVIAFKLNLSLPATAAFISISHLAVLAAGGFILARQRNVSTDLSMIVALVAAMNGWIICWGATTWIPALTSFTWLPWAWWGLNLAISAKIGIWRFLPSGIFIYLILTAGWPFTVLMLLIITLWITAKHYYLTKKITQLWTIIAAWIVGIGLASPALLMLVEYNQTTSRPPLGFGFIVNWIVPIPALLGTILPSYPTLWFDFNIRPSIELACTIVPILGIILACVFLRKKFFEDLTWEIGLLTLFLILATFPSWGSFRWSFRWLPIVHICLSILGAEAFTRLRKISTNHGKWKLNAGLLGFLLLGTVWIRVLSINIGFSDINKNLGIPLLLILLCWAASEHFLKSKLSLRLWMPFIVVWISFLLTYLNVPIDLSVPVWNISQNIQSFEPLNSEIDYLALYQSNDVYSQNKNYKKDFASILRFGNTSMYANLSFINGYSPMKPSGLNKIFNFEFIGQLTNQEIIRNIIIKQSSPQGLLDLMGVDGLVIGKSLENSVPTILNNGWQIVLSSDEGTVLKRINYPSKKIRSLDQVKYVDSEQAVLSNIYNENQQQVEAILIDKEQNKSGQDVSLSLSKINLIKESRNQVVINVEPSNNSHNKNSIILFSRAWYPGYKAYFNGKPLDVKVVNLIMPAVELPPGAKGELILKYFPDSLQLGIILVTITLTAIFMVLFISFYRDNKGVKS